MVCRPPHGNPIDLSRLAWDAGSSKVAGMRTPPWQNRVFLSRLHGSAGHFGCGLRRCPKTQRDDECNVDSSQTNRQEKEEPIVENKRITRSCSKFQKE